MIQHNTTQYNIVYIYIYIYTLRSIGSYFKNRFLFC